MTREERCWADLCKRLQRDPATSEESDTCTLRVAFKHALAFADAEAAAMRERAALECEQQAKEFLSPKYATGQPLSSLMERFACAECADAIRALPVTGEVGRG